ncbi:hypothetical protein [Streptomyces sp. NPDC057381]|uniref:hypothetical protein n=1 Tax=Streptomyces sp. NPDC057381 TaxID=3346111 RepID=UPI003636B409
MAEVSYPSPGYNSRQVTDIEHELLASRFSDDGVYGEPHHAPVVTAGTGLSVNVRADVAASVRGHGWYSGGDTVAIPVSGNISSQARIDWVVLRLDRADWTVRAAIVGGTPGAGAPALTQDPGATGVWEIPLAQVRVLGGASSVTVTRAEQYVGARCRPCTSTTRNPLPRIGEQCFETDTGIMRLWTGEAWKAVFDDSGTIVVNSPLSAWDITADSVLEKRNGSVHLRLGAFVRASSSEPTGPVRMPVLIPAAYRHPTRGQYAIGYVTGVRICRLEVYAANTSRAGQVWMVQYPAISKGDYVMPGSGISWVVD